MGSKTMRTGVVGLRTAVCLVALTIAAPPAFANEAKDPTITGSLTTGSVSTAPKGSPAFQAALGLVKTDPAGAYVAARGLPDNAERRVVQWAAIYLGEGAIDYNSVVRFAADAPDFGSDGFFRLRIEQALNKTDSLPDSDTIKLLGGAMPLTLDAQLALAHAYERDGQAERAGRIIKSIWRNEFLDAKSEQKVTSSFSRHLTRDDHWARAVHLLMHDRASGTERIMGRLSAAQKSLALARIAVSRKAKNASSLIDKVDPSLRDHPLFHFSRGQYARDNGRLADAVKYLDNVSGNPPDAAEFWYERRLISRRALANGDFNTAYGAAAGYRDGPEGRVVDSNFHAGWIALAYLNKPDIARQHFEKMRSLSTLSGSVTKSNFWLGRALKALGQDADAKKAFEIAAAYNTVYYGQLARLELGIKNVGLQDLPAWRDSAAGFEKRELTRAVNLLVKNGHDDLAEIMVQRLMVTLTSPGELILAARLAQSFDAHHVAIRIATRADNSGHTLDLFNYPKDGLPANAKLAKMDKAAIYAVARQESKFEADAVSRSGARGLMQLMPGTAKEVAQKVGVTYSSNKLTDPAYNALLGSTYLAAQLDRYDGSLVLAAAAYNAGPGNANKWLKTFGDPRNSGVDAVSWVETIPFAETRLYVQRVMANYMVYRARLGNENISIADALRRIPH